MTKLVCSIAIQNDFENVNACVAILQILVEYIWLSNSRQNAECGFVVLLLNMSYTVMPDNFFLLMHF